MLVVPLRFLFEPAAKASFAQAPTPSGIRGWSTSSFGTAADTSPLELRDLSDHLGLCRRSSGRFFPALCLSDRMNSFLAPRFITTLAVIALIAAAVFLAL
ncbi:MAG: hypothetical protein ABI460_15490 [Caldimonas sp.]